MDRMPVIHSNSIMSFSENGGKCHEVIQLSCNRMMYVPKEALIPRN